VGATFTAPELPYKPRDAKNYRPQIGLIGCGGISATHLKAYMQAGYNVVALCDKNLEKAEHRRETFFPKAMVTNNALELIEREDIQVLDITTHANEREALIEAALRAKKHVLSQKPFVTDLDIGLRLCNLADEMGVKLAVNQNGRWAPHLAYMREAARALILGEIISVHVDIHWDHTWTAGTPFENVEDLVLYDFGIHWFDFVSSLIGTRARRVQASRAFAASQTMKIPMLAQALIEFDGGQASLVFDAHLKYGARDQTYVGGSLGSITSQGANLGEQTVTLYTQDGIAQPKLEGAWFDDGFHGAMAELFCAIEEDRQPINNARDNLQSLALCFAAIAASQDGTAKIPLEVRKLK
jgi:predicted dehydrogenase